MQKYIKDYNSHAVPGGAAVVEDSPVDRVLTYIKHF